MLRTLAVLTLALGACHHAPAPKPPPAELAVVGLATIAGTWVTDDAMDWSYRLAIAADGTYVLHVDRNRLGACDIKGRLVAGSTPKAFTLAYGEHQCRRELSSTSAAAAVASYTGDSLELDVEVPEGHERRRYTRAPTD